MNQLIQLMRWESTLLWRNKLAQVSLAITVIYIGLFQLLKMLGNTELFAILLTLNDPALISMLFAAVTIIFERESGSLDALRVSPMGLHTYLLAKLLSLGILGTACGYAMALTLVGWQIDHAGFLLACGLISWFFGCIGIILIAKLKRFIDFMLPMAGSLILMVVPLLDWFGILPIPFKWLFPLEHGISLMAWSFHYRVAAFPWLSLVIFILVGGASYAWAYRRFSNFK
jgi:hypothetical protein